MTVFHAAYAWVGDRVAQDVRIETAAGRITSVTPDQPAAGERLPGLVLPGLANVHSHAFHRALRGRTHDRRGSFWTWRDLMYQVAGRLDPDGYHALARAVYAEMALAGITAVGEFHYLHHQPDGTPYADPNAMGNALIAAAADAGLRITLLDTLYLSSNVDGAPLTDAQRRFGDENPEAWAGRVAELPAAPHAKIGSALHSVRAVPARHLAGLTVRGPLHLHLSEQRTENEQTRAVHATHLTDDDVKTLGRTGAGVCFCPTTERDLADGIGPARDLVEAGAPLSLGSDSHAVIDMFEEMRGLEMDERLASEQRGRFTTAELIGAAARHDALGWDDAGAIAPGKRADLVAVRLDGVRAAGMEPGGAVYAATAADVSHVIVDGRTIVADGRHVSIDVARELRTTIQSAVEA